MTDVNLTGSCLCGKISYEIQGTVLHFNHCHCQRCRKVTGTGHATNIILNLETVTWPTGEDLLVRYRVPDAKRFSTAFCSRCGSQMPRITPDGSIAVIPAGTLDSDPGIRPERHIFQDSRADWSCEATDLPAFDTYPPRK